MQTGSSFGRMYNLKCWGRVVLNLHCCNAFELTWISVETRMVEGYDDNNYRKSCPPIWIFSCKFVILKFVCMYNTMENPSLLVFFTFYDNGFMRWIFCNDDYFTSSLSWVKM